VTNKQLNEALAKWAGRGGQAMYPDYCGSLDAVAELEVKAPGEYWDNLAAATEDWIVLASVTANRKRFAGATARQRAEALAKAVGVWRDET